MVFYLKEKNFRCIFYHTGRLVGGCCWFHGSFFPKISAKTIKKKKKRVALTASEEMIPQLKVSKVSKIRRHFWRNQTAGSEAQKHTLRYKENPRGTSSFAFRIKYKDQEKAQWLSSAYFLPQLPGQQWYETEGQSRTHKRRCYGLNRVPLQIHVMES